MLGSLLPLSDGSRLNSALLQCQQTFPLEYRYRRISSDWAFLAGAGFVCRDCSLPFGIASGFNRAAAHTKEEERERGDRGQSKRRYNITEDHIYWCKRSRKEEMERVMGCDDSAQALQNRSYFAVTSASLPVFISIFKGSRNSASS